MAWQNQEEILKALGLFLAHHPGKKICIIWDNAAFHKGKEIRNALAKGHLLERVHLVSMPPYAPDHNPIEMVWKDSKKTIANVQYKTLSHVTDLFQSHIRSRNFNYKM